VKFSAIYVLPGDTIFTMEESVLFSTERLIALRFCRVIRGSVLFFLTRLQWCGIGFTNGLKLSNQKSISKVVESWCKNHHSCSGCRFRLVECTIGETKPEDHSKFVSRMYRFISEELKIV